MIQSSEGWELLTVRAGHVRLTAAISVVLLVASVLVVAGPAPRAAAAGPCDPPVTNVIACENSLPGTPRTEWEVTGDGDAALQGFATQMSLTAGQTQQFKVKATASTYRIDIYRLGYYQGNGARKVATLPGPFPINSQVACATDSSSGLVDCGNWSVTATWDVPADAVSGVYLARLVRTDNGSDSQIPFVVRDEVRRSDVVVQTSDSTWQAYNTYGGNSLYQCTVACPSGATVGYKAAYKVSYNRPFNSATYDGGASWLPYAEIPMIRFLERNGYDVSYISQLDTERRPALLLDHKLFISSGHDEYWSGNQRSNVEAARDQGVSLAFFSGNEMFWKTRYEADSAGNPARTLVSYKDTKFDAPADPVEWTGTWRDPRFRTATPENALTGQYFMVNAGTTDITVPSQYAALRMWRNTPVASLAPGQSRTLGPGVGTLGYEWDTVPDNGFRPAGLFTLSSTTAGNLQVFTNYGSTVADGQSATHNLSLYRAPSGAMVFGAGTVQWAWGLDDANRSGKPVDPVMQQATVNLFADMGVQPATLISGLVAATRSTNTVRPTSTITSPAPSTTVADGTVLTLSGTATAAPGAVVAGVEVSTDGGTTWRAAGIPAAAASTTWSYTWTAHGYPSTTIRTRAVDDAGLLENPAAGTTLGVTCPCSVWGGAFTPAKVDSGDTNAIEVGVKFSSDVAGTVNGIRFYKSAANTGTHVGNLWTASGQLLARATFTSEGATGWQQVNFTSPVTIQAGTTYVASYFAPVGRYSADGTYLYGQPAPYAGAAGVTDSKPLRIQRANGTNGNGVYRYAGASAFPDQTFNATNYWVDVSFTPAQPPPAPTAVQAYPRNGAASVTWSLPPANAATVTSYTVTPYAGTTALTPVTVTGNPAATTATVTGLTNGTAYTFTVTATNSAGTSPASAASTAVTPSASLTPPASTITSPSTGAALSEGSTATITGTATTSGGAVVTGVEVSTDNGTTWRPATVAAQAATTTWTFDWTVDGYPSTTLRTRTTDNTGYVETPGPGTTVTVNCPCTLFTPTAAPATPDAGDTNATELGVKFTPAANGVVTGVRFYKSTANTGTHRGTLWSNTGQLLATALFTNETASGWQEVTFSTPVNVTAGTTYVASYYAPVGRYSATGGTFTNALNAPPLTAPASSTANGNGVYRYSTFSAFPDQTFNATNYWVDVRYNPVGAPSAPTQVRASARDGSASVTWSAPPNGGLPITSYTVTPYAGTTALTPVTVTGNPAATTATVTGLTNGTAYTFTVTATNSAGTSPASSASAPVTPAAPPAQVAGVTATPGNASATVTWAAPANGGATITSYTVTPFNGTTALAPVTVTGNPAATSATVTGLTNGTAYTFTVTATNAVGASPASAATAAVTPLGPPAQVAGVTATPGNASAIVTWAAPANGGATITSYTVTPFNGTTALAPVTVTGNPAATSATVTGLTNGTAYTFTVTATNAAGAGTASAASAPATPRTVPGQVTGVTTASGNTTATVSWVAPANNGATITSYTVTPRVGTTALTPVTVTGNPAATTVTVTGLTNGTAYTFTVAATNAAGTGTASAASAAVTPAAVAPVVDARVSVNGTGTTATTPALSTTVANTVLVAFVASDGPSTGGQTTTVSGAGLAWTLVRRQNTQLGVAEIWTATATARLASQTVRSVQTIGSYRQQLSVVAFRGSSGIGAANSAGATRGAATVSLTTTRAGSVVYGVGVDTQSATSRTVGAGQTRLYQWADLIGVNTYWVQNRNAATATAGTVATLNVTSPTTTRWNLAAVEVLGN
ncbi:MAG: N,N-dimethylformamidase beta subunit family domain-containing protein [Microthrixaceae bacterium]